MSTLSLDGADKPGHPGASAPGRHAIAGAQEPEVLERLLDIAITEGEFA